MKRTVVILIAVSAVSWAQNTGGRGNQNGPPVASLSQRPTGSSLGTIRVGAADEKIWFGWHVAIPAAHFRQLTFSEVVPKSDTLGVTGLEVASTVRTSAEVPKPFDYRLQTGERAAVVRRLREYNQAILAYRVADIGS